jgi:hypothetical protein
MLGRRMIDADDAAYASGYATAWAESMRKERTEVTRQAVGHDILIMVITAISFLLGIAAADKRKKK